MSSRPDQSNQLLALRQFRGSMTQRKLAERVGVSRQTIWAIENGKQMPAPDVALRIAQVLDASVEEVFEESHVLGSDQGDSGERPGSLTILFDLVKTGR